MQFVATKRVIKSELSILLEALNGVEVASYNLLNSSKFNLDTVASLIDITDLLLDYIEKSNLEFSLDHLS
jgi:hypothetical protein